MLTPWAGHAVQDENLAIPKAFQVASAVEVTGIEAHLTQAPKIAGNLLKLPLSVTVSDAEFISSAMVRTVNEAAIYAPNTLFAESTSRRLSLPYVRGIGGSGFNPGVTTFIDGVPQFHSSSSSLSLLDVAQIDLTRGPMGTMFGRNTVGGGIHITSKQPSRTTFGGEFQTTFGNYNLWDFRGSVSGPLIQDHLGLSLAGGLTERDGYSKNTLTGQDADNRSAKFGKAQFLWTPDERLEVRLIVAGESDRDGEPVFTDLKALRQRPHEIQQDFRGNSMRDVIMPTLQVIYHADVFDFTSTTGYVGWKTDQASDLDYTATPLVTQLNQEQMRTWTQEFRFANPLNETITLNEELKLSWQAGLMLFHNDYRQNIQNSFPAIPIPYPRSTQTELTQLGIGSYTQGTLTWKERLSLTAGLRWDHEKKEVNSQTSVISFVSPARQLKANQSFSQATPQMAITYQFSPSLMTYLSLASGYKAGGFNNVGPAEYDEERSRSYELGLKGRALKNKLSFAAAAFFTDWQNLQITQSISPSLSALQNVGKATSSGLETTLALRLSSRMTFFGSASWQTTELAKSTLKNGVPVGSTPLPYAPEYSFALGALFNQPLSGRLSLYARVDIQTLGSFQYDFQNNFTQDAYTLANFRLGLRQNAWFVEAFTNNAFNTDYIPIASTNNVGENGAPITVGMRVGIRF
jgi:iron complex outermembrane receptor protein